METDNATLNENFRYAITDPTQFDPDTPPIFSFAANRPDLESRPSCRTWFALANGRSAPEFAGTTTNYI